MKLKSLSQKDRYGNMFSIEFFEPSIPSMMIIPEMSDGYNGADTSDHPGDPRGTDTVPAWLTPGENVVNAEASRIPGNQEKIDEMNEEGRMMQKAQGGPIPTYESDGGRITPPMYAEMGAYVPSEIPSWLTPELLDSLMQVESGGDVNAVSRAGAVGPYQIMPATAANPGYNTQAIAESDMRDPDASRRFAQQYLSGIQASNPDFTPAEVLQAYNAGAGRIANFKAGKGKPLAEETVQYADKVLSGVPSISEGDVPVYDLGDQTDQEPGFMSAQAATAPSTSPFLQGMGGATQVPVILDKPLSREVPTEKPEIVDPLIEGISIGPAGAGITTADIASDIVSQDQITIKQNQDAIPVLESNLQSAKEEEAAAAKVINDKQAEGKPIYQNEILRHQEAKSKVSSLSETVETTKEETKIAQANVDQDVPPIQSYNTETGEFDDAGIPRLDDVSIPDPTVQAKKDAAMAEAMEGFRGKTFNQPSADEIKEVERLGNSPQGEGIGTEVMGYFRQMFKDLFSGPELARMAVTYAGSRLMGYDHGGSLQYSMQQYINRVDAANTQFQKDIRDDDYQDFTEESRKEFEKTRDYSVLRKKPPIPQGVSGTAGTKYDRNTGKIVQVYTVGEGANKRLVVNDNGSLVPATSNRFEVVQAETHNLAKVTDRFNTALQAKADEINKSITDKEGKPIDFATQELAQESANFYNTTRQLLRMDVNASQRLRSEILGAQADYMEAMRLHAEGKGDKPTSIEGFYNRRVIGLRTGKVVSFNDVKNTDVEKLADLENQLMTLARNEAADPKTAKGRDAGKIYREYWQDAKDDWSKMKSRGSFTSGKTPGYDPFIAWVQETVDNDPDALKLSEESNLKK